ncbi:MAG: Fic family protein [Alphaproteobacteria bacterium]|nr:Fic family protein [Alphaproteobacteria bacterium]
MFDPFGDFDRCGYLRNFAGEKDIDIIKHLEHRSFLAKIEQAFAQLVEKETLSYSDVLTTHGTIFSAVYPWAGQDRNRTAPHLAISKGDVLFAHPNDVQGAIAYALRNGQDIQFMADKPGEIMGYLAYGHPFLDGNGRTILVIHAELAQRAGFSVDWGATNKTNYLTALTEEIKRPGKGHLDNYLRPFIREALGVDALASHIAQIKGLDGEGASDKVLGEFSDPSLQARYQHEKDRRGKAQA